MEILLSIFYNYDMNYIEIIKDFYGPDVIKNNVSKTNNHNNHGNYLNI